MPRSARSAASRSSVVPIAAIQRGGAAGADILAEALEAARFWKLLDRRRAARRGSKRELSIAIKPDLDLFEPGAPTGTDPALVESLIGLLRLRGYDRVVVCDGRNRTDDWLHNRDALCVPDLVGYRFEAPAGHAYDMVFSGDDAVAVPLSDSDRSGALRVNRAWMEAEVRISFAKAKTDDEWGHALTLANLLGLVDGSSEASRWSAADRALHLLRRVPPHFALVDAVVSSHGSAGARTPRPLATDTVLASPNALLVDWLGALKMGLDPERSPLHRLAVEMVGMPREWALAGDAAPWVGWENPSATLVAAVQGRARWPELDGLARAVLQPVDRERFPFRDVVIDQVSASVLAQLGRVTDRAVRDTIVGVLARLLDTVAAGRFALVTNVLKGEIQRSHAPLAIDVDELTRAEFDRTEGVVEAQARVLDGAPTDARGFHFRTVGGHIHFGAERVLPCDFAEFVSRVDISAGIRLMNDYLGGSWVVVDADPLGRPLRQAERNVYLPQPNWIGAVGGEPIDVEKVERIAYSPDRHALWWRTVRSPNGTAESDDGRIAFVRTPAGQVQVRIFARQRFRLPMAVAAMGVERWPAVHGELVAEAYARFFEGTVQNLLAAFEGRPYRIGRDLVAAADGSGSELRAVLAGAFAVISRALGWAPAGGVQPSPTSHGGLVEPLYVDERGFAHFPGQAVPAFVTSATGGNGGGDDPLTPMLFLTELGRAVGRDLAALGIPDFSGMVATATAHGRASGADPAGAWAAAHLGVAPPINGGGWQ